MTNLNIKSVASISNIVAVEAPATDSPEKHINSVLAGFNYSIDDLVPLLQSMVYVIGDIDK